MLGATAGPCRRPLPTRPPAPAATRRAFGSSAAASASRIMTSGSLIARLVPDCTTGLPANRSWSLTPDVDGEDDRVRRPDDRRVERRRAGGALRLDVHVDAGGLAGGGELVGGHVGVRDPGRAGGDDDDAPPRGGLGWAGAAAAGRGRGAGAAAGSGAGGDDLVDQRTISSSEVAARSDATNSGRTSARASAVSRVRWSASPCAGAAIRKTRSAGPSGAPKSTFGDSRAKASDGLGDRLRAAVRDRDAAGQAGGRLGLAGHDVGVQRVGVGGAAGGGDQFGQPAHDRALVGAQVGVERDQVGGDQSRSWGPLPRRQRTTPAGGRGGVAVGAVRASLGAPEVTRTAEPSTWAGVGTADPGSEAAAEP